MFDAVLDALKDVIGWVIAKAFSWLAPLIPSELSQGFAGIISLVQSSSMLEWIQYGAWVMGIDQVIYSTLFFITLRFILRRIVILN